MVKCKISLPYGRDLISFGLANLLALSQMGHKTHRSEYTVKYMYKDICSWHVQYKMIFSAILNAMHYKHCFII